MNELVFLNSAKVTEVPFTTSDIIAEQTGNSYRSVQRIIEKQQKRLAKFGRVRFQITPFQTRGGIQKHKLYMLNEEQATLLITFLKNTDVVADFKVELVRQFYAMRTKLMEQAIARENRKPVRRTMTDAIQTFVPESPHKKFVYKHYTDLAYRAALGKPAAQIRKERGIPAKANLAEYLSAEENDAVQQLESRISVLVESGLDYDTVRKIALERFALTSRASV